MKSCKMCLNLKWMLYVGAVLHLVIGFVAVTNTAASLPEMVRSSGRQALFWCYMLPYFTLALLFLYGIHKKSLNVLRVSTTTFALLQLLLFSISVKYIGHCKMNKQTPSTSGEEAATATAELLRSSTPVLSQELFFCQHLKVVIMTILLPMFFHTVLFTALLVAFIYQLKHKIYPVYHKHPHVQIIVEEVL